MPKILFFVPCSFEMKCKNPPDPGLFISTAITWSPVGLELSFADLEVQSFPVLGSKYKFSLLDKLLVLFYRYVYINHRFQTMYLFASRLSQVVIHV